MNQENPGPTQEEFALEAELSRAPILVDDVSPYTVFPCKITTAKGQQLLGIIEPSAFEFNEGRITIPFGAWDENSLTGMTKVIIGTAKAMGVFDLLGKIKADKDKEATLGIDDQTGQKVFKVNFSRGILEEMYFDTTDDYNSNLDSRPGKTSKALRAARLITIFKKDFPGWQVEALDIRPKE